VLALTLSYRRNMIGGLGSTKAGCNERGTVGVVERGSRSFPLQAS
jgi:hypothetical protein